MQQHLRKRKVLAVDIENEILTIEVGLARAGITLTRFCADAKISVSTWTRWRSGKVAPNFSTWRRVQAAFAAILNPNSKEDAA